MSDPRVTIEGVPESIPRADYLALMSSLGLDPYKLIRLEFGLDGIYAEVLARDENGHTFLDPVERNSLAKHRIHIRVVD